MHTIKMYTCPNNKVANIVGTNGEATLNSNGKKLIDFCTFNNLKIMKVVCGQP